MIITEPCANRTKFTVPYDSVVGSSGTPYNDYYNLRQQFHTCSTSDIPTHEKNPHVIQVPGLVPGRSKKKFTRYFLASTSCTCRIAHCTNKKNNFPFTNQHQEEQRNNLTRTLKLITIVCTHPRFELFSLTRVVTR
jgi:hypothetical protein